MSFEFTKENIDLYLKELAKEYRKQGGKAMPAELVLIGGASVLINYGFRNMTTDVDAMISGASAMKDAIHRVGDRYGLPNGWLNSDFTHTDSYTPKLAEHAKHYRTFANVLSIYTVSAEYLIAMKLRSGRQYKNDLSDVLGILAEHEKNGAPISMEDALPESSRDFISNVMGNGHFAELYAQVQLGEQETKALLTGFEKDYPAVLQRSNVDEIAGNLQSRSDRASILRQLQAMRAAELEEPDR